MAQTFIARQPIFDRAQRVYAYELLFRSGRTNAFDHADQNHASSKLIAETCLAWDLKRLTSGKLAFVNVTEETLVQDHIRLLPKGVMGVEILENVNPTPAVLAACRKLKRAGYQLALDDFVDDARRAPLTELADIIKVDFLASTPDEQKALAQKYKAKRIRLVAEKIETPEVFQAALAMGYNYFQGYFFCRPVILTGRDAPASKLHYFQILKEIHGPEIDFKRLEEIVKREPALSYKLLRYSNSAFFGAHSEVHSIKQALTLLGEREIKKWVSFIALMSIGEDKPEELMMRSLIRAKFCETLAEAAGLRERADELFLVGLFSLLDAMLDRKMSDLLREMSLSDEIKTALLRTGEMSDLREAYECVLAYEQGDWELLNECAAPLAIGEYLARYYTEAVDWSHECFSAVLR